MIISIKNNVRLKCPEGLENGSSKMNQKHDVESDEERMLMFSFLNTLRNKVTIQNICFDFLMVLL